MPRLFRLGYLEIGRDAYIARGNSTNVLRLSIKLCTRKPSSSEPAIIALHYLTGNRGYWIKNMSKNEWESIWNASNSRQLRWITASRQGHEGKKIYCNLSKRKHVAYLSHLRTGHCNLRQYHHRFRHEEDPYCDCGDGSIENVEHYLLSCRKYDRQRDKLQRNVGFGQMWIEKLLGHPRLVRHTLEFVEETKMMRIGHRNELQELWTYITSQSETLRYHEHETDVEIGIVVVLSA